MRLKTTLQAAVVLALAVVVGLVGVGGTWALWNASTAGHLGTVQAADVQLRLNGTSASSGLVTVGSPAESLTPGRAVHTSFTVTNATDATGDFRVSARLGTPVVTGADGTATPLSRNLTVQTTAKPAQGDCSGAVYGAASRAVVGKNATVTFCVRFTLADGAPATAANSTARVIIPVTATQIQPIQSQ